MGKIINFYSSPSAQSTSWGEVPENITALPFFKLKKKKKVDEKAEGEQRYRKKLGRGGIGMGS